MSVCGSSGRVWAVPVRAGDLRIARRSDVARGILGRCSEGKATVTNYICCVLHSGCFCSGVMLYGSLYGYAY